MAAARGTRALLISVLLLLLTAAAAASSGGRSVAAAPIPRDGPVRVEVVLDVSGSMARPTGDGRTRMQAARDALSELVRSLPRRTELGLRLYGSEYDGNERRVACRDTRLVHPIQRLDPAAIERQVAGLRPTGDTPIGHALRRAASDFPRVDEDTQDVIVLISDGEDTCGDLDPPT